MEDKFFLVNLERSRIYWDYYKSIFLVLSLCLMAGMISTALIFTSGAIDLIITVAIIGLLFLAVILLAALMSLAIWRHEGKHLEELLYDDMEPQMEQQHQPPGIPLV